jgi:predicted Zn-dependent protease
MAGFLGTLEKATVLERADARQPSFFDSHPSTPERVAAAAGNAQAIPFQPQPGVARSHEEFLRKLEGLVVGQNAAEGVVEGSRLLHPGLGFQLRYPEGWKIINGRSAVLASPPNRDAVLVLELERQARSPREAAALFMRQNNLQVVEAGAVQLAQGSGFRALVAMPTQRGNMAVDLTWVPLDGRIYRMTGLSNGSDYRAYQGAFASVARSFRDLTPEEMRGIQEQHLRIVPAQAGESLGQLLARTRSSWKLEEAAVANALAPDARLQAGQLVKVAIGEPYSVRGTVRASPPTPPPQRKAPAPRPANEELEPL